MRILLSDGSGLTSRQVATVLGRAGHTVDVLDSSGFALTHATRWVSRVHKVPPYGADPFRWLDAALRVLDHDVLLATQEQVAMLSLRRDAVPVAMAVPAFGALRRVLDKVSAIGVLAELGLPHPPTTVARSAAELLAADLPAYVKLPIGTASTGVRYVADAGALRDLAGELEYGGGVLVQRPVAGPMMMVQAVFDSGRLVAWHACHRVREAVGGGASSKRSDPVPAIGEDLAVLGAGLGWHGALSADAILTDDGPVYIDLNPRIVEPLNAQHAGVDLIGALLEVSRGGHPAARPPGPADVRTHQLLLALLACGTRRTVAGELASALSRTGAYRRSAEELTPVRGDARSLLAIGYMAGSLLVSPTRAAARLTGGAIRNYALTPDGWRAILAWQDRVHG